MGRSIFLEREILIVDKISDVLPDTTCVIIGTIYIQSNQKPSILREISGFSLTFESASERKIYVEDETSRLELRIEELQDPIIDGSVAAVFGKLSGSTFIASKILLAGAAPKEKMIELKVEKTYAFIGDIQVRSLEWERCKEMITDSYGLLQNFVYILFLDSF